MKVGLIGHRGAGKTTIFNMLTGLQAQTGGFGGKEEIHLGVIKVPDARIDKLSQIFKPKKTTYAEIRFTDFPPSEGEENLKSNQALVTQMREVDAITLVLRDFGAGATPSGNSAASSACDVWCVRCVRNVRRAPICSAAATASGIERCSGCGRGSSAFSTRTSSPARWARAVGGISFASVRYATGPTRYPNTVRSPWGSANARTRRPAISLSTSGSSAWALSTG